jgi:uncharacterized cupredoxin-like copper-binding protein
MMIVLSYVLTACGTGGSSTDLKVELANFTFMPNHFIVPAGKEISLTLVNSGDVVHEFVIMKLDTTVGADFGPEDEPNIYWEIEVQPGSNVTATFTAPAPGEYQVVCGISGHFMAGMVASMTVVAP